MPLYVQRAGASESAPPQLFVVALREVHISRGDHASVDLHAHEIRAATVSRRTSMLLPFSRGGRGDESTLAQNTVRTAPMTRGSSDCALSRPGMTVLLSNAVHGWEMPHRITSPSLRSDDSESAR